MELKGYKCVFREGPKQWSFVEVTFNEEVHRYKKFLHLTGTAIIEGSPWSYLKKFEAELGPDAIQNYRQQLTALTYPDLFVILTHSGRGAAIRQGKQEDDVAAAAKNLQQIRDLFMLTGQIMLVDATPSSAVIAERIHKKLNYTFFSYPL